MSILAPRQHQMLSLVAAGLGRPEIAAKLGVDYETVKATLSKVYRKLGVTNSAAAVMRAIQFGELKTGPSNARPTTVRESPNGAIAVQVQTGGYRSNWLVVRAGGGVQAFQRLDGRDVAGWQTLWSHNIGEGQ